MKICVLNGSPKGEVSVTMQYVKYLQKSFPQHELHIINITHQINKLEKDTEAFDAVIQEVKDSDGVLWAFPLYVCLVHAQYKRFIELLWERKAADVFEGKYAAALSTSIHFFDHMAHNYIHAVCDDLGMKYTGFFSAAMDDLMKKDGREKLVYFAENFFDCIKENRYMAFRYKPVRYDPAEYVPAEAAHKADNSGKNILLITDIAVHSGNLRAMAKRFGDGFTNPVETVDLNAVNIKGGCLGCMHCGYDNSCVYKDSDDIKELYDEKISKADIVVFALHIKDRFFSARFKTFTDRRFMHTHQPMMDGKQIGYIVSGPLADNPNIGEFIHALTELDGANLAGIVTDEDGSPADIDAGLKSLAESLLEMSAANYIQPQTFLGVGGHKIFRDEIFSNLRFVFRADHKYYKKHRLYDFPQKKVLTRIVVVLMSLMQKIPGFRRYVQKNMKTLMLSGYRKVAA